MADDKKHPRVEFRVRDERMKELLDERTGRFVESINIAARRGLNRHNTFLDIVRPVFTRDQAMLLVDVFNGTHFEPIEMSLSALWASLDEAEDAYYEKHSVEKEAFVKRVHNLTKGETLAVIDAIERFWNSQEKTVIDVGLCGPPEQRN